MSVRSMLLVFVLALVGSVTLFAQTDAAAKQSSGTADQGSLTIEDLYLSQEVEVQLLRTQAQANNRESKLLALQDIRSMIESGKANADSKEVLSILDALAGEGVYKVVTTGGEVSNNFPDVRRSAVELLGKIGGRFARDTMLKVLSNDKETMVQAEAVYALGVSATADNKDVLPFIAKTLHVNNSRVSPDQNLANSCLLTIEKIAAKQKGIADPEIINAVLDVAYGGRYITPVVRKAFQVLGKLRSTK